MHWSLLIARQIRQRPQPGDNLANGPSLSRELMDTGPQTWRHKIGCELSQGQEHKRPLAKTGVGDLEVRQVDLPITIQQNVEINGPRPPAHSSSSTKVTLDLFQAEKQRVRVEASGPLHHHVEVTRLVQDIGRRGFVDAGQTPDTQPGIEPPHGVA